MDGQFMTEPLSRDQRRFALAKRLITHRARTATIISFTGLTSSRFETCRRRWGVPENSRRRGYSPRTVHRLLKTTVGRAECAAIASVSAYFGLSTLAASKLGTPAERLALGERLCSAIEAYSEMCPGSRLEFERVLMVIAAVGKQDVLDLKGCSACDCLIAHNPSGEAATLCFLCEPEDGLAADGTGVQAGA